jgi:hypothetical protein
VTTFERFVSTQTDAAERQEEVLLLRSGYLARDAESDGQLRHSVGHEFSPRRSTNRRPEAGLTSTRVRFLSEASVASTATGTWR